jgi:hypothetical protein
VAPDDAGYFGSSQPLHPSAVPPAVENLVRDRETQLSPGRRDRPFLDEVPLVVLEQLGSSRRVGRRYLDHANCFEMTQ